MTTQSKKLIEVALPLEAINVASAREKSIRHGHPSTLHLWWARRPLAAARAVIFAQMVDDPSGYVDTLRSDGKLRRQAESLLKGRHQRWVEATALLEKAKQAGINAPEPGPEPELDDILAEVERNRLFKIIEDLVQWENTTNEEVLNRARAEIWQSWRRTCAENAGHPRAKELFDRHKLPAFHDPFAGGGALPLEAQRLGLEAYASDLNPVAVLINKAMIEIPPKFAGKPPVNPDSRKGQLDIKTWKGAQGLAEDVRYYGRWMRDEAEKRIGHLYPKVQVIRETDGAYRHATPEEIQNPNSKIQNLTVIAWLWARTVKSPNPAFREVDVPLASTFMLSTKPGKEAWVEVELGTPASQPACDDEKHAARDGGVPGTASLHAFTPSFLPASRDTSRVITSVESPEPHLGWHSRGYLPHWDHPGMIQALTFRLHDAVPREVIEKWQAELDLPLEPPASLPAICPEHTPASKDAGDPGPNLRRTELLKRIEKYEDAGHGDCWLRDPRIAALVENAMLHFDGQRYRLIAWCIMPNHVHALIETWEGWPLAGILHSWKSFTASQANKLLGRSGPFWFREYHDRYIRNAEHYAEAIRYIEGNPVKAGLARLATDWPFSSARRKTLPGAPASQPACDDEKHAARDGGAPGYRFVVKTRASHGAPPPEAAKNGTKLARGANFGCVMSGTPVAGDYIKAEGKAGRMGARLMAIVAEGERGRVYLSPTPEQETAPRKANPEWKPETPLPADMRSHWTPPYGLTTYGDLFTPRQLVTLTTFSDLVGEVMKRIRRDAFASGLGDDGKPLRDGGTGATAYAEAVGVYLGLAVDKATDYNTTLVAWSPTRDQAKSTFARQGLSMVWDYAEVNQLARAAGDFSVSIEGGVRFLENSAVSASGLVVQANAARQDVTLHKTVSTDPPYYDNIGYADLSDFFYVWLRRSLRGVFPDLFATLAVPKGEELVATPYRHGSKEKAEAFFLNGMTKAMHRLAEQAHPAFPVTIYYAFKQAESESDAGTASTGWETFLDAVIRAGFGISGTWPMRTERGARSNSIDTNALASSIVLVCRPRAADAPTATRREFVAALQRELPEALRHLQASNIAPVDLAQAAIGPGMAVFTRYAQVLDAQGHALSVREALALINETLDTALAEQEGDFDPDSRWALAWFEQFGFDEGEFGVAETLSKAKNTSVQGLEESGILKQGRGKVRILKPDELPSDWDPATDDRLTNWETVHHLIRVLGSGGESAASELVAKLGSKAEPARELCYRLYTLCERKKRAAEALSYNALVQSWPEITRLAQQAAQAKGPEQGEML